MNMQDVLYDNLGRENLGVLDDLRLTDDIKSAMKNYAKLKCKEQRELCYESHWNMSCSYPEAQFEEDNIRDAITEAPEPEFD